MSQLPGPSFLVDSVGVLTKRRVFLSSSEICFCWQIPILIWQKPKSRSFGKLDS